jgi:predicted cupin superfamily sugar epimerase
MYSPERLIGNLNVYIEELNDLVSAGTASAEKDRLLIEKSNIEVYAGKLETLPANQRLTAKHIELGLALEPHPEGGYYREFIRTGACTVIFYLLPEQAISSWHSLQDTKEKFKLISGDALCIPKIDGGGLWKSEENVTYGNDVVIEKNDGFGDWFGAYPAGEYGLVTCECKGPFEFAKFKIAGPEDLAAFRDENPRHRQTIDRLAPKNG